MFGISVGSPEWKRLLEQLYKNDSSLTEISLSSPQFGADAKDLALALKNNRTLTRLYLNLCFIGDAGAKDLAWALKDNRTLTSLYLGGNQIGDAGAKDLSFVLKDSRTLTYLYLGNNQIGSTGAKDLALILRDNQVLTSLDLTFNQIGTAGAKDLAWVLRDNRILTHLALGYNQIGDTGAKDLSQALKGNKTLTSLDLWGNQIGDAGVKDLSLVLKDNRTLTSLYLWKNQIGDAGAKDLSFILKDNRTLTNLYLGHNQIGDTGAKDLSLVLRDNRTLTSLDLTGNQIGAIGAKDLSLALKDNRALAILKLIKNQIGDTGAKDFSLVLQNNRTLTHLYLEDNQIRDMGAQALALALKDNQTLVSLYLGGNQIGDIGTQALAVALKTNKTLTHFSLNNNQMSAAGAKDLALALKNNWTLISCSFSFSSNDPDSLIEDALAEEIEGYTNRNEQLRDQLYEAIQKNDLAQVQLLIQQGVSMFSTAEDQTPLHKAVLVGSESITRYLITLMRQQGLPLDRRDNEGKTAFDLAKHQPVLSLLFAENTKEDGNFSAIEPIQPLPQMPSKLLQAELPVLLPPMFPIVDTKGQLHLSVAIAHQDLSFGRKLGEGGFGVVYQGEYHYSPVAIKQLAHQVFTAEVLEEFNREVSIMARLRSPYVVQFYGACFEPSHYALVMEYMPKGSLYHLLQSPTELSWDIRYQIGVDVSCGMAYLHKQGIIHGDLKSLNILLDNQLQAKISDFGLAKVKLQSSIGTVFGASSGGSLRWMAPELLLEEGAKNTKPSDVYSYGMVLWELSARQLPLAKKAPRNEQVIALHYKGVTEDIPPQTPLSMAKLIGRCWDKRAESRPSMDEAIKVLREEQQLRYVKK